MIVDLALAIALVVVAWLVLGRLLRTDADTKASATAKPPIEAANIEIRQPRARADYNIIVESKLFGNGANMTADAAPATAIEQGPIAPTKLPLRLVGTAAAKTATDPVATATIENVTSKTQAVYYLNDEIMAGVKLVEVQKRKVLLDNTQSGKRELLSMDEEVPPAGTAPTVPGPGGKVGAGPQKFAMKKEELVTELSANYADLLQQVNPEQHTDANGKVDGYTSKSLSKVPLAKKLGLQDNDVLQQINGVTIDSPEKIVEVATKFKDNKTFQLTIQRGGKPQVITYNLE